MRIEKQHLDDIKRCYCASNLHFDGCDHPVFASEDPNVGCRMYSGKDFDEVRELWKEPGGCMSIIQIPQKEDEFLAVQEFYLKVSPSKSKLVRGKLTEDGLELTDLFHLPFLHRFDILKAGEKLYIAAATIARDKDNKEDWSRPGQIWFCEYEEGKPLQPELVYDGLFRNHGLWHAADNVCLFGSDQGILKLTVTDEGKPVFEKILDGTIGEIATADLDGDGIEEIMTIEPFHGNEIHIYKQDGAGNYERVWSYDNEIDFAHTLIGTTLAGQPAFVAGVRRKDAELFIVTFEDGEYRAQVVDRGFGPANLCVVNQEDRDLILAANHTGTEAAVYTVTKE